MEDETPRVGIHLNDEAKRRVISFKVKGDVSGWSERVGGEFKLNWCTGCRAYDRCRRDDVKEWRQIRCDGW